MNKPAEKTSQEILESARALVPVLRERAKRTEEARRMLPETLEDIQRASLLHMFKPRRYGGFEMGLEEYVGTTMELARGDVASSWAFSLLCEHNLFVSLFPLEAQDDIWGRDSYASIAASITHATSALATRVPGGFRLSGKFGFASGSDCAQWLMIAAMAEPAPDEGDEAPVRYFLMPIEDVTPVDDWYTLGMRGTGSHAWVLDDVFIPEHRTTVAADLVSGRRAAESHPTFDLLQYGRGPITTFVVSGPVAGMAQGAVERFSEIAGAATRNRVGRLADSDIAQLMVSESAAEAFTAWTLISRGAHDQMEVVRTRQPMPQDLRQRVARDSAYVGVLAQRCIDRLHLALGAQAVFEGHPFGQYLRDVHTAVAQVGMNWQRIGPQYGKFVMGAEAPAEPALAR